MKKLRPGYYEIKPGWNKRPTIHIQRDDNIIIRLIKYIILFIQKVIHFIIQAFKVLIIIILISLMNYYINMLF